jgi:tetratricopeptide (TPR) repeat protein
MSYDRLTTEELTDQAEQLEESGKLDEALEFWRAATRREADPVVLCEFASLATRLGKWSDAEEALLSAVNLAPELPNPYTFLGVLYFDQDMLEKATEYFQKSLAIERSASALTQLGVTQLELGLTDDARASLEEAIRIDPNYEEAYYNLALTYREEQQSKVIELFERAIELDPEYGMAHRELGWALSRGKDKDPEAEYHLRRAIELNDEDGWAHIYLGNILWRRRDQDSAEQCFKRAVEVWSEISTPYWCLALFYEYENRPNDALKLYDQALRIDPEDPVANKTFGKYLLDTGQDEKAREYLRKALALDPEDETTKFTLTRLDSLGAK